MQLAVSMFNIFLNILDKCVLNKFGYQLEDLAIVGYSENSELASSAENTCRGKLNYEFESSYIFEVKGKYKKRRLIYQLQHLININYTYYTNLSYDIMNFVFQVILTVIPKSPTTARV